MDTKRRFLAVAFGVEIAMKVIIRDPAIHHLDSGDFDDAVAQCWIEAGGLGVEYDLPHSLISSFALVRQRCLRVTRATFRLRESRYASLIPSRSEVFGRQPKFSNRLTSSSCGVPSGLLIETNEPT